MRDGTKMAFMSGVAVSAAVEILAATAATDAFTLRALSIPLFGASSIAFLFSSEEFDEPFRDPTEDMSDFARPRLALRYRFVAWVLFASAAFALSAHLMISRLLIK
jgi:hypothetical protein